MLIRKDIIENLLKITEEYLNDKWITIKPHGEDSDDYRRLKLEDGETPKEAIDRVYKKKKLKKQESQDEFKKRILKTEDKKYKVYTETMDWGYSMRGQGKRIGKMVIGAMSGMPRGKQEYKSYLRNLPEFKERQYLGTMTEFEQFAYFKARNAGYSPDDAELFAFSLYEPENLLYKKEKEKM